MCIVITSYYVFFSDDVVAEFQDFKKAQEDAEQPKDICTALPGWGDWGGDGIVMSTKKKKRYADKILSSFYF